MGADASKEQIWRYLGQYVAGADAATWPELDRLIDNAMAYNRDFVAPTLQRRKPQGGEVAALRALDARLAALPSDAPADDIQNIVYEKIGRAHVGTPVTNAHLGTRPFLA